MLDSSVLVGIIRGEPDTGRLLGLLRATNVFSCQAELVEQTAGAGPAEGVPGSDCKRVEEADAGLLEAGVVARDNDQVVGLRAPRREDLRAILPTASPFQLPTPSNEAAERPRRRPLETGAPFPFAQQQNAESQLAEDYGSTAYSRSSRRSHSTTLETAPAWSARSTLWRRPDTSQLVGRSAALMAAAAGLLMRLVVRNRARPARR